MAINNYIKWPAGRIRQDENNRLVSVANLADLVVSILSAGHKIGLPILLISSLYIYLYINIK